MSGNNKKRYHHHYNPPQVEVQGDKEVLARSIDTLGLPEDTLTLLKNNKFNTIYDVAKRTERDMFRVQTFNKKHLIALKRCINAVGIDFLPFVPKEKTDNQDNAQKVVIQQKPLQQNDKNANKDFSKKVQDQKPKQQSAPQQEKKDAKQNNPQQNNRPVQNQRPQKQDSQQEHRPKVELPLEEWVKVTKNGKWGFSNGLKTVIEPKFDEVFCFKDGLACVDINGMFGYIDKTGAYAIEPKFECAMSFSEGMAVFFEGEKCGYINKKGEVVLSAKYDAATAFENGRAKVKEFGKWSTIDPTGNTLWSK